MSINHSHSHPNLPQGRTTFFQFFYVTSILWSRIRITFHRDC